MEQRQKGELFRILDPALPTTMPTAPNRLMLAVLGLFGALGLAPAVTFLAEQFDTSFHSLEDLRAFTRVPVLASIPRIVTVEDRSRWRRRAAARAAAVVALLVAIVAAAGYVATGNEALVALLMRGA
jgi:hypothetical protein